MICTIRRRNLFAAVTVGCFTLLLAFDPAGSLEAAKDAMELAGRAVIPALFPFFVCSELLIALDVTAFFGKVLTPVMRPIFNISGGGALALVLGLISGYPTGARTAAGLVESGAISKEEGERLLAFCNNSGPLFILGAVGAGMLGRPELGLILYGAHFLSSITVGVVFGLGKQSRDRKMPAPLKVKVEAGFGELLGTAIKKAVETVFMISGYVIIFNILIKSFDRLGVMGFLTHLGATFGASARVVEAFVCGFFEPTNGARAASMLYDTSPVLSLMLLSAVIGWAGISVHLQVLSIISKAGLSPKQYFSGKLFQAMLAPIYTVILLKIIPTASPVFFVMDVFAKNGTSLGGLVLTSVCILMLGIAEVLIFCGLAGMCLLVCGIIKNRRGCRL